MTDTTTKIKHLLDLLNIEPHDIAHDILDAADGYDNRMSLLKDLLELTSAVAYAVADQNGTDGDGYDVCPDTGETHEGSTPDEGRALALACYADGAAAYAVEHACDAALLAYEADRAASDAIPCEVSAEDYVAQRAKLYA